MRGECMATVGAVSNPDYQNQNLGKAGRVRWMGRRPHVRGVAMNPVDHPHGGGEGRTSGGVIRLVLGVSQPRVRRPAETRRLAG